MRSHPCSSTYVAFGDRPRSCGFQRLENMLFLDVKAIDVVKKPVVGLRHQRQTRISGIAFSESALDVPFDYSISHNSDTVRVSNQNWSTQAAGLFQPGRSGHLPVAIQAVPRSKHPTA